MPVHFLVGPGPEVGMSLLSRDVIEVARSLSFEPLPPKTVTCRGREGIATFRFRCELYCPPICFLGHYPVPYILPNFTETGDWGEI